jgi:hypothetical protein
LVGGGERKFRVFKGNRKRVYTIFNWQRIQRRDIEELKEEYKRSLEVVLSLFLIIELSIKIT